MKNISYKGIALGVLAILLLDLISGTVLMIIFLENMSPEALDTLYKETTPLIFAMFFGSISNIIGGYIAAKYGNTSPYLNSFILGLLGLGFGVLFIDKYPLWFNAMAFLTVIPTTMLGGYLFARRSV